MPYLKLWIHLIWTTKNRERIITQSLKKQLLAHILEHSREKGIYIDSLNCVEEHIHVLISLGASQSVSKVAQLIKGESSHWVNSKALLRGRFEWQDEYIAISVSESDVQKVRNYILNQEEHHRRKTFMEEYSDFMEKYPFGKGN